MTEKGGRRWNIHRSEEPHLELFLNAISQSEVNRCAAKLPGFSPYIWYELRDEIEEECVNGNCQPSIVEFDVEVVAPTLREMKAISKALKCCICELNESADCGPAEMGCGLKIQMVRLLSASDGYETQNQIVSSLGGFVRSFTLEVRPAWW